MQQSLTSGSQALARQTRMPRRLASFILWNHVLLMPTLHLLVLLLPVVQECSAACYESLCMQMETPCLADSLRGSYSVSCNT